MKNNQISKIMEYGIRELYSKDSKIYNIFNDEIERQKEEILMVASCSLTHPAVLACQGSIVNNVTAEGYPGKRYHAGCLQIDKIENLAIQRAKEVFGAQYVNVQPHSATTANEIVLYSLLEPGDIILGMNMSAGGHLSHGASVSFSGQYFKAIRYGLNKQNLIDYEQIEELAYKYRPKIIICGTTAYSRVIDFERYRNIADKVGAYLLADISHISGLVATGLHPSPIDYAHITTTCTHKQLFGPRGGLIMSGKDAKTKIFDGNLSIEEHFQKAVFPFFQGAPMPNMIAAKATTLELAKTEEYCKIMKSVVKNAQCLALELSNKGYEIISGGTDTHIVLVNLRNKNINGAVAEKALESCGIIVNKNSVPNSHISKNSQPLGIRIGLNSVSQRGFGEVQIRECATLIDVVLKNININDEIVWVDKEIMSYVRSKIRALCYEFPIEGYY